MTDHVLGRGRALIGGTAGLLVFVLITVAVKSDATWLHRIDSHLGSGPQRLTADHHWLLHLAVFVARVSHPDVVAVAVVLAAVVVGVKGNWRAATWSIVVIETARWGYLLLKVVLDRQRPHWAYPVAHAAGSSFPSGHSTVIAAAAGVTVVLATRSAAAPRLRAGVVISALVAAAVVGLDRVLLGVHYPSDVVAGLVLGFSIVLLGLALFDPLPHPAEGRRATIAP